MLYAASTRSVRERLRITQPHPCTLYQCCDKTDLDLHPMVDAIWRLTAFGDYTRRMVDDVHMNWEPSTHAVTAPAIRKQIYALFAANVACRGHHVFGLLPRELLIHLGQLAFGPCWQ